MSVLTAYQKFIQQALKYGFSLFGIPRTMQTLSYTANDDGAYQKGYPKRGARFTDNGDGTITDNGTGLMWVKDPENDLPAPWPGACAWELAIMRCESLTFAGHSDWRLPNINELLSILDYSRYSPAVDPTFFPNTINDYYWTSSTWKGSTGSKHLINFIFPFTYFISKTSSYYVRPVRLGR